MDEHELFARGLQNPLTSRIAIVDRPENALALELDAPEIMAPPLSQQVTARKFARWRSPSMHHCE